MRQWGKLDRADAPAAGFMNILRVNMTEGQRSHAFKNAHHPNFDRLQASAVDVAEWVDISGTALFLLWPQDLEQHFIDERQ